MFSSVSTTEFMLGKVHLVIYDQGYAWLVRYVCLVIDD
jgi:hypothetical protein